jgi:hypothetical protein
VAETDCVHRAAVAIELVSADSFRKTGILADKAGDFRRFPPRIGVPETKSNARKVGISGPFSRLLGSLAVCRNCWLGGRNRTSIWRLRNRMLLPVREELQNPISSELTSVSKHSNFENRTESAESRALERNEPFGENGRTLPIRRPELKSEIAANTGPNYQHPRTEKRRLRRSWRRERNWDRTFSA